MKENMRELNSKIEADSEIGDLFSNKLFLTKFTDFIRKYLGELDSMKKEGEGSIDIIDEKIDYINDLFGGILEQAKFSDETDIDSTTKGILLFFNNLLDSFLGKNNEVNVINVNLFFENLLSFFNDRNNLIEFLTYVSNDPILKKSNVGYKRRAYIEMLRISDYLLSNHGISDGVQSNNSRIIFENDLKEKVGGILHRNNKLIIFKLAELNFPLTIDGYKIVDANFDNTIVFDDFQYLQVQFYDKYNCLKKLYINKQGAILKLKDDVAVEEIKYTFTFGNRNFIKYIDINYNEIMFIIGDNGEIYDFKINDAKTKKFIYNGETFDYLLGSTKSINENSSLDNYNVLFDENMELLIVDHLLNFINDGKVENFIENMDSLKHLVLTGIKNIKIIDGSSFLELEVIGEDELKYSIVITGTGKILSDNGENITNIYELEEILGKKFLNFGCSSGAIAGFLDKNFNTIKIPKKLIQNYDLLEHKGENDFMVNSLEQISKNNKKLNIDTDEILNKKHDVQKGYSNITDKIYSIKKSLLVGGVQYFILNNNPKLIISEMNLKKHLDSYDEYSDIINSFEVTLTSNKDIVLENGYLLKDLVVKVDKDKKIYFYNNENDTEINYDYFIGVLKKSSNGKELLKYISQKIS